MEALNLGFIGMMTTLAAIDIKTMRVPVWALVGLSSLAICHGFMFYDLMMGFLLMAFSVYFSDFVLKRETLGGGDLWVGTVMSCFMGFDKFLIAYTVAALCGSIAMATVYRNMRIGSIAYLPYMAAGAFWAMFIAK